MDRDRDRDRPERRSEIVKIAIADAELCFAACHEIYAQRPRWRGYCLNQQRPFYTLGAASYLDLGFKSRAFDDYLSEAGTLWSWAGEAIRSILLRVREALAAHLGGPVEYPLTLPAPGFHIFLGPAIPNTDCADTREGCGSVHLDMQYRFIPWKKWYRDVDLTDTVSFTLPLKLPAAGGGLLVWESLTLERLQNSLADNRLADIAYATAGRRIPYDVGSLIVHSGHLLHQIAGVPKICVTDERITLQGHGVFADGIWRLYW